MNANAKPLSERVIGCAFSVSNALGCGFLESVYANALALELAKCQIGFQREHPLRVFYRGESIGYFKVDLLVDECLVVEIKAVKQLLPEHEAQLLNYLKAGRLQVGLLLNFGSSRLVIRRMVREHNDSNPI